MIFCIICIFKLNDFFFVELSIYIDLNYNLYTLLVLTTLFSFIHIFKINYADPSKNMTKASFFFLNFKPFINKIKTKTI
jgi:hypothetical protein